MWLWILVIGLVLFLMYDVWAMYKAGVSKTGLVLSMWFEGALVGAVASTVMLQYEWTVFCWWMFLLMSVISVLVYRVWFKRKRMRMKAKKKFT